MPHPRFRGPKAGHRTVHAAFETVEAPFRTSSACFGSPEPRFRTSAAGLGSPGPRFRTSAAGFGSPEPRFRTSLARFRTVERRCRAREAREEEGVGRGTRHKVMQPTVRKPVGSVRNRARSSPDQRCRLAPGRRSNEEDGLDPDAVQRASHPAPAAVQDVGVDHGRRDVLVTQQLLYRSDVIGTALTLSRWAKRFAGSKAGKIVTGLSRPCRRGRCWEYPKSTSLTRGAALHEPEPGTVEDPRHEGVATVHLRQDRLHLLWSRPPAPAPGASRARRGPAIRVPARASLCRGTR